MLSGIAVTIAYASMLSAIAAGSTAVVAATGTVREKSRGARVGGTRSLSIQKHECRTDLQKSGHGILKLHERCLCLKICRKTTKHLENKLVLGEWCIDIVQPVGQILQLLAISHHGGVAFDGRVKFMLELHGPGMFVVVE
ncbi:unnamed protein product [Cuscuta campestris]|uniref:Uncharacterized protein n=1 Tax=Cuscuta campestris TaxID=132261 RepID=A0A484L0C1_9ASTE|nr:unnamed protein product [Cuscuta campestris]